MMIIAEVISFEKWEPFPIETALRRGTFRARCIECHGRVRAHKEGDGLPAHYEHYEMNPGLLVDPANFRRCSSRASKAAAMIVSITVMQ